MLTTINFSLSSTNRTDIRKEVAELFIAENPGNGTGVLASEYRYNVETTLLNECIFIKRPANLNKGFDFTVNVENRNFGNRGLSKTMPSHKNIIADLELKKQTNSIEYNKLKQLIDRIYNCTNPSTVEYSSVNFNVGLPVDLVCKIIKWLFIEQDITYWNFSGRSMFYSTINNI